MGDPQFPVWPRLAWYPDGAGWSARWGCYQTHGWPHWYQALGRVVRNRARDWRSFRGW